jgi:hypothetical protein
MLSWLQNLWSAPAEQQVEVIEQRERSIEDRLERVVNRSRIKGSTDVELEELLEDINVILDVLQSALNNLDAQEMQDRAANLLKRAKSKKARVQKAKAA